MPLSYGDAREGGAGAFPLVTVPLSYGGVPLSYGSVPEGNAGAFLLVPLPHWPPCPLVTAMCPGVMRVPKPTLVPTYDLITQSC